MKKSNSQIFNAVLITILACLVVFALALYIFGSEGFWTTKTPVMTPIMPTISGTMIIPISLDKTGSMATGTISCTLDYKPVCGTDSKTYSNACFANAQGVIVENEGVCQSSKSGTIVTPPSTNTGARACTLEYAPACGSDGKTYSNTCMAGDMTIAHMGECGSTSTGTVYDTGSYLLYTNSRLGYGFAMPRYSHYSGLGARDGAIHSVVIATTASGVLDFATAPVQIWLYTRVPATPPSSQSVQLDAGVLYIRNNDTTGNVKISNIIDIVMASAK